MEVLSRLLGPLSNITAICIATGAVAGFFGGYPGGILSALMTFGYAVYPFARLGADNQEEAIPLAVGLAIVVALVGGLRQRLDDRQQEVAQLRDALEARSRELGKQQKRKELLLYLMLHKLRHSMNSLAGYLEFARSRAGTSKDAQLINDSTRAAEASDELSVLIANLVDFVRLDEKKTVLKPEELDLSELVEEKVQQLAPLFEKKNVDLKWNQPLWLPLAKCDRDIVGRVMENLLRNALQQTPDHGVIQVAVATAFGPGIEVMVKNSGPGISAAEQEKLFRGLDELRTEDLARQRGGGIEFALCRMAIEAHGGTITAQSRAGDGTTVTFRLPMKTP